MNQGQVPIAQVATRGPEAIAGCLSTSTAMILLDPENTPSARRGEMVPSHLIDLGTNKRGVDFLVSLLCAAVCLLHTDFHICLLLLPHTSLLSCSPPLLKSTAKCVRLYFCLRFFFLNVFAPAPRQASN